MFLADKDAQQLEALNTFAPRT